MTRVLPVFGEVLTLDIPLGYYRIHGNNSWMNSEAQANWIENEIRYTEYVNKRLEDFGVKGKIDFRKSLAYKFRILPGGRVVYRVLQRMHQALSLSSKF